MQQLFEIYSMWRIQLKNNLFLCVIWYFCCDNFLWFIGSLINSIPSMALQPLLGPGLPQKTPAFFFVFCSSPNPRIPRICDVSLRKTPSHRVIGLLTGRVLWNFPLRIGWLILFLHCKNCIGYMSLSCTELNIMACNRECAYSCLRLRVGYTHQQQVNGSHYEMHYTQGRTGPSWTHPSQTNHRLGLDICFSAEFASF